jgi:hypothetical protein
VVSVGHRAAERRLYIQRLDESSPRPLERTEGASRPVVSPDGRSIAYFGGTRIEKIAVDGSDPISLSDMSRADGPGLAWLKDGPLIAPVPWLGPLTAVSPDDSTVPLRTVSTVDQARGEIGSGRMLRECTNSAHAPCQLGPDRVA